MSNGMSAHTAETPDVYRNDLKNREYGKEAPCNLGQASATEAAKLEKFSDAGRPEFSGCPTPAETDSSGCFGMETIYSAEELSRIDSSRVPNHISIIMDGNRRWAKQRGLPPMMGHWEGAETLTEVIKGAAELGIKTLTVYAFSTENWGRPQSEVEDLMNIFELYLMRKKEHMLRDGVRLHAIGDLFRMPERVVHAFNQTKSATEHCDRINLVLALNYGGRDEIRRAIVKIVEDKISPDQITEDCIGKYLDTCRFGDPELLIRTSGEMRVSNFLLWQISYAEIFSTEVLWPDFNPKVLLEAVCAYQKRCRRVGG